VIKESAEAFVEHLEAIAWLCSPSVHADILVCTPEELQRMLEDGNPSIFQAL
jgi:hypothetical protein